MICGYIRVSSDKQTVENQRFEIKKFCTSQKLKIDDWIEETISGTKAYNKRELGKLLFAFGLSAEIERNLISQRTKEALERKRAEGVVLGRPKGRRSSPEKYKLHSKRVLVMELLKAHIPKRQIAKICKVDRNTLDRYIKHFLTEQS